MESTTAIKAILFDLDNTVLDRTSTFRTFAVTFIEKFFRDAVNQQEILERVIELDQDGYKDKGELFSELLEQLTWEEKPSIGELMEFYKTEYVKSAMLMEGAIEVIHAIRGKYQTGLITNGKTEIQYGKIDQLGIRALFDVIVVSEEAGVKKPDAEIFHIALRKLGRLPEECLYIGDHPVNDIEGAARVGMATIWLQVNQPWREGITAGPLHCIHQLRQLLSLL